MKERVWFTTFPMKGGVWGNVVPHEGEGLVYYVPHEGGVLGNVVPHEGEGLVYYVPHEGGVLRKL